MRFLILFVLIVTISSTTFSQQSVVELIQGMNSFNEEKFIKSNYIETFYTQSMEEQSKSISINGEPTFLTILMKDSIVWTGNTMVNHSTIFAEGSENILTTNTFKWDNNEKMIYRSTKYTEESSKILDEEFLYDYDDKNRLKTVKSIKPNIPNELIAAELIYDDHPVFPTLVKASMGLDLQLERGKSGDTILFNFKVSLPAELLEMARKQMGEDATEEELLQALGPLGRIPKAYSKIYRIGRGQFVEETYEENQEGLMEKTSTIHFNSQWQTLSKEWKKYDLENKIKYNLDDQGRKTSVEVDGNTYKFEYDSLGNIIKEYSDGYIITYDYVNNKLMSKLTQSAEGDYISEYSEYTYY